MSDPEKKICRYFNTLGGCWYGDNCKFLHIPNKKPPCKFYGGNSSTGCRYGESCHFSHDRAPFKSVENYNNTSVELIKEVFKENMDPSELSGTNNNNMTQPVSKPSGLGQQTIAELGSTDMKSLIPYENSLVVNVKGDSMNQEIITTTESTNLIQSTELQMTAPINMNGMNEGALVKLNSVTSSYAESSFSNSTMKIQEFAIPTPSNGCLVKTDDAHTFVNTTANGCSNGIINDIEIYCGSCKRILERHGNESYCTLLKDHYLECFLDKEGDHVKCVKIKAALEPGQMYWCKSCILIFEKPWSLFQHMADKAKGNKVQRWEKKIHLDWMDNVAGLMAGYDLGLFSSAKLRVDLRNLLADQHTVEEEMEAAAVTAAAMMHWLAPLSSPWRLQQRDMMRKIEQLNRQMLRKANLSLSGHNVRSALTGNTIPAPASISNTHSTINRTSLQQVTAKVQETPIGVIAYTDIHSSQDCESPRKTKTDNSDHCNIPSTDEVQIDSANTVQVVGPVGDREHGSHYTTLNEKPFKEISNNMGASGDAPSVTIDENNENGPSVDNGIVVDDSGLRVVDSNNTNSATSTGHINKNDELLHRNEYRRENSNSYAINNQTTFGPKAQGFHSSFNVKSSCEPQRFQTHGRNPRSSSYGHTGSFGSLHRNAHRSGRGGACMNGPPNRGANVFNPPSFHASLDLNFGFTNDEVEELLSQGIKPWDSEAAAALAVLRGDLDHLLD